MFGSSNAPSLSDIAAVTRGNDDGFGGNNGWWILIILFALFGGWGRNGGYGDSGVGSDTYLASDVATLERKLDTVNSGLCDGFYAQNTNILNGFAGVNNAVCTLGYQTAQLANGVTTALMQSTNALTAGQTALSNQLQQCCCDNKQLIGDLRYEMSQMGQQIMLNCNNNYRQLHDEMVAAQIAAKDETIAQLRAESTRRDIFDSNEHQTATVINAVTNALRPAPVPSYIVPNPYDTCGRQGGCCNNNSCCGY